MRFIWNNIFIGIILNLFVAPFAYLFRERAQRKRNWLWTFLSTGNMYGDKNWRPKLKNKFLRAYLWMIRNPRQNHYWKDYVDGVESNYKGTGKVKFGTDILSWRTVICSDTGDWHGKIIDFENARFGIQDITFTRTDSKGNIQKCFRKSVCKPYRFWLLIILFKRRSGHENGLLQYNFTFPTFSYSKNKTGYKKWKSTDWKLISL